MQVIIENSNHPSPETEHHTLRDNQQRNRRRLNALLTALLVLALVLISVTFVSLFDPGAQRLIVKLGVYRMGTVDEVLNYLDVPFPHVQELRYEAWPRLVTLGRTSQGSATLQSEAAGNGIRSIYANMALFKLRNEPQTRLRAIISIALQEWPLEGSGIITRFLTEDLSPQDDASAVSILRAGLVSLDNPDVRSRLRMVDERAGIPIDDFTLEWARRTFKSAIDHLNSYPPK
jgi:hypothetical protein